MIAIRFSVKSFFFYVSHARYVVMATGLLVSSIIAAPTVSAGTRYETGIATNASLLWMNDAKLDNRLKDIKNLGATWIRVDFSWSAIQPDNAADYNWDMYDRVVQAAGEHHLGILAVLGYTPRWARDLRCQAQAATETTAEKCSPRSATEFGRFARAAVMRYHTQSVRGWEIWNEPNLANYWKTPKSDGSLFVDPIAYAQVANAAASQIRQHTDAVIITGGLSPLFEPSPATGMRQSDFLAEILPHLNPDLFDGIGIHPYSWPVLPGKRAEYNAFYTTNSGPEKYNLQSIMRAAGWYDKQIWGTEYGASTVGKRSSAQATRWKRPDHVTENTQAQIISQGIDEWYIKPNVGPLFIHSDSDEWLAKHSNEGGFGLRRNDGSKKPAYESLQSTTQTIRNIKNRMQ